MLRKVKELKDFTLGAIDGAIGKVKDFYFDDECWTVRYLIADTGDWIAGHEVLISPTALRLVDEKNKIILVNLTREQIEHSPSPKQDKSIDLQFKDAYKGFFGWPMYWLGPTDKDGYPLNNKVMALGDKAWDHHMRSARNVMGHHVQAVDGELGRIEDFVIDDETWMIRHLIVSTQNWLPGKEVLVSPQSIERVSWLASKVYISLTRDAIQHSPQCNEKTLTNTGR